MASVALQGISKVYPGGIAAVSGIDLAVGDGELFVLVGPSGSGKTTLLRLIAGLDEPSSGSVWFGERRVDALAPADRDVAMVFQNPALYPHLTVFGNLAFGLRARRVPRREVKARVAEVAERLGLTELLKRKPATLSGGQRQRVALGRAIVRKPAVFLLDEPLSSLDAPLRAALRGELIDLHRKLGLTTIHVTHDQAEALALGDRIAVMNRGRLEQVGAPRDLYDDPTNRFAAEFIGSPPMSLLPCRLESSGDSLRLQVSGQSVAWSIPLDADWARPLRQRGSGSIDLGLRPEQLAVAGNGEASQAGASVQAEACVSRLEPLGHETLASLEIGAHTLTLRLPPRSPIRLGERVSLRIDLSRAAWFDSQSGQALSLKDSSR